MKKQSGYTLIEIMIALLLGLIIVAATITIYINTIRGGTDIIRSARLNHDLESALTIMTNDIKRAGYWNDAKINNWHVAYVNNGNNPVNNPNPFTADATNLNIIGGNCILYSYDADKNGNVGEKEFYGFRFRNNTLEIRLKGLNTTDCNNDDDEWQGFIVNDQLNITDLQFSFTAMAAQAAVANVHPALPALDGTSRCLNITTGAAPNDGVTCTAVNAGDYITVKRVVNIHLTGTLDADTAVTKTLSSTVKVRNDRIFRQ
ncbi:PilW family protein [Methylobacter sp. BBA5.1]|uniref:PilW family protein n=1 Tax=Methylobacter sp. BBA5.1 TaxID=1495064 RepID=UPI00056257FD|nr:prepilin-type N-terminal cleavage/methylation domain-containing protein [Methylobacter sp. BBA5.1]